MAGNVDYSNEDGERLECALLTLDLAIDEYIAEGAAIARSIVPEEYQESLADYKDDEETKPGDDARTRLLENRASQGLGDWTFEIENPPVMPPIEYLPEARSEAESETEPDSRPEPEHGTTTVEIMGPEIPPFDDPATISTYEPESSVFFQPGDEIIGPPTDETSIDTEENRESTEEDGESTEEDGELTEENGELIEEDEQPVEENEEVEEDESIGDEEQSTDDEEESTEDEEPPIDDEDTEEE